MQKSKEIQCMNRLIQFTNCYELILNFLLEEKIITEVDLQRDSKDRALHIYELIKLGRKVESLLLVSYDWVMLPKEHISLTIVTNMTRKVFSYSQPS